MIINNTIYINAPLDTVWKVTEDVEKWSEWTPTIDSISLTKGIPLQLASCVEIKQPGQPMSEWTVTTFIPHKHFEWEHKRAGLWIKASHEMHKDKEGTTNILQIESKGILTLLLWPILFFGIKKALQQENMGLKKHCEEILTQG